MKIYSEKEIIDVFTVEGDLEKTLNNLETYIFYLNKIDKVAPKLFLLLREIQNKLCNCARSKSAIICFKDSLNTYKKQQEEDGNNYCDIQYVYKTMEEIDGLEKETLCTKKEIFGLLDRYIDEHERVHQKTFENVYKARNLIMQQLSEERNKKE
jgi:hypothetical protein